jgi:hypothetical protein
LILVSSLLIISAQTPLDGFVDQIENTSGQIEDSADKIQKLSKEDVKWQELGIRWKEILLKNHVISKIDESLKKGNIVFVVLFGRDYSLSLTLLFLIMLWFYFWSQFSKILGTFSTFSSGTSTVISLGMTIILAQIRFFDWASQVFFKLIFYRTGVWGWIWNIGIFFVVIMVAMIFGRFFTIFSNAHKEWVKKQKEAARDAGIEYRYNMLKAVTDSLSAAFSKDGENPSKWLWVLVVVIIIGLILGFSSF